MSGDRVEPKGINGVAEDDAEAYHRNYAAHVKGISQEQMIASYSTWAEKYDADLCPGRYNGPSIAAEAMAKFYTMQQREEIEILDVAAGTGRVGLELSKLGFKKIDALEPASGMLAILRTREIYGKTYETPIGNQRILSIPSNSYDSLVIAGGMGEGHIPVEAMNEMIRIVKPGGTVFIVMREEYLSYVEEYVGKLEPFMQKLEAQGDWNLVSRNIVPDYSFNKNGVVFNHVVLKHND